MFRDGPRLETTPTEVRARFALHFVNAASRRAALRGLRRNPYRPAVPALCLGTLQLPHPVGTDPRGTHPAATDHVARGGGVSAAYQSRRGGNSAWQLASAARGHGSGSRRRSRMVVADRRPGARREAGRADRPHRHRSRQNVIPRQRLAVMTKLRPASKSPLLMCTSSGGSITASSGRNSTSTR